MKKIFLIFSILMLCLFLCPHTAFAPTYIDGERNIIVSDDGWIGLDATKGRLVFDDTPTPDQLQINDAGLTITGDVGIGVTDPDTQLEVLYAGNQLKLSFDGTDNTIFAVDISGDLTITPSGTGVIITGQMGVGTSIDANTALKTSLSKDATADGSVCGGYFLGQQLSTSSSERDGIGVYAVGASSSSNNIAMGGNFDGVSTVSGTAFGIRVQAIVGANKYDIVLSGAENIVVDKTGILTLGGIDNTYNENLTIDFEPATDTNTIAFGTGTGVTDLDFGNFNLITSGAITGTSYILEGGTYDTTIQPGTPTASVSYTWPLAPPASDGYVYTCTTAGIGSWGTVGDVIGPSSSVDKAIARFHETTGKIIQAYTSGGPTISDTGQIGFTGTGIPKKRVYISATAGIPRTTNACADAALSETTTNKINYYTCDFDADTDEFWQAHFTLPENYDASTFIAAISWTCTADASKGVAWFVQLMSIADNDTLDSAFGTAIEINDDGTTTGDYLLTAESAAITASGTPTGGDELWIQVYRDADDADDDLTTDGKFIGIWLTFGVDALSTED